MFDFKSYTESGWFKILASGMLLVMVIYIGLHCWLKTSGSSYMYTPLTSDQKQFINELYVNHAQLQKSGKSIDSQDRGQGTRNTSPGPGTTQLPVTPVPTARRGNTQPPVGGAATNTQPSFKPVKDSCISKDTCICSLAMNYLYDIFGKQLEPAQDSTIRKLLSRYTPLESIALLNSTQFKVHSFFWLISPLVYLEIVFWSIFGVLCNLLFFMGALGSNRTTDLGNPQTQFDNAEIPGQIAKILYTPLCVLVIILGYNSFKKGDVVSLDSGIGLIVFSFIGGYSSGRIIALIDRLRDIILPNSGTASLDPKKQGKGLMTVIQQLQIQLAADPGLDAPIQVAVISALNLATVLLQTSGSKDAVTGIHNETDPDGLFTFTSVVPGNYVVKASLQATPAGAAEINLTGEISGQFLTGTTPVGITLKEVKKVNKI